MRFDKSTFQICPDCTVQVLENKKFLISILLRWVFALCSESSGVLTEIADLTGIWTGCACVPWSGIWLNCRSVIYIICRFQRCGRTRSCADSVYEDECDWSCTNTNICSIHFRPTAVHQPTPVPTLFVTCHVCWLLKTFVFRVQVCSSHVMGTLEKMDRGKSIWFLHESSQSSKMKIPSGTFLCTWEFSHSNKTTFVV